MQDSQLLEKAATIRTFEYLALGSELKKQKKGPLQKGQYKFLKYQINMINNIRE